MLYRELEISKYREKSRSSFSNKIYFLFWHQSVWLRLSSLSQLPFVILLKLYIPTYKVFIFLDKAILCHSYCRTFRWLYFLKYLIPWFGFSYLEKIYWRKILKVTFQANHVHTCPFFTLCDHKVCILFHMARKSM